MVKLDLDLISYANLKEKDMSITKAFVPVKKWVDPNLIGWNAYPGQPASYMGQLFFIFKGKTFDLVYKCFCTFTSCYFFFTSFLF